MIVNSSSVKLITMGKLRHCDISIASNLSLVKYAMLDHSDRHWWLR